MFFFQLAQHTLLKLLSIVKMLILLCLKFLFIWLFIILIFLFQRCFSTFWIQVVYNFVTNDSYSINLLIDISSPWSYLALQTSFWNDECVILKYLFCMFLTLKNVINLQVYALTHQHIIKETLTHLNKHLKEICINFNHSKMINELFPFLIYIFNVFISLQLQDRLTQSVCDMHFLQFILILLNKRRK